MIARNEDSPNGEFTPKEFVVVNPEEQPRHYRSVISHVEIDLPDDPLRYTAVPDSLRKIGIWGSHGVNECNVAISNTETITTNERVLGADPLVELQKAAGREGEAGYRPEVPGGIGEEDILTLVLPYARTAREGVRRYGEILRDYGTYEMNGIAISDVDEICAATILTCLWSRARCSTRAGRSDPILMPTMCTILRGHGISSAISTLWMPPGMGKMLILLRAVMTSHGAASLNAGSLLKTSSMR